MYHLQTCGYGYSTTTCKDIVDWFITKYLPRHKLFLNIQHRGLKRECAFGFCDIDLEFGDIHRPRDFTIDIQSNLNPTVYAITLIHELIHLRQWVKGQLKNRSGRVTWDGIRVHDLDYSVQPHEIEAFDNEWPYYVDYIYDTKGDWLGDE